MIWPFRKKPDQVSNEGEKALREARERLRESRGRWCEVNKLADSLERHNVHNHYGEAIANLYRGRR